MQSPGVTPMRVLGLHIGRTDTDGNSSRRLAALLMKCHLA